MLDCWFQIHLEKKKADNSLKRRVPHGFEVSQQVRSAKGEREGICQVFSPKLFMILGFLEFKKLVGKPVDHPQKT